MAGHLAYYLAFAFTPLGAAQIAEVCAADASYVIAASFLLDDMPTVETPHEVHLPTELHHVINHLLRKELILMAGHPLVPLGATLEANSLLTPWATNVAGG